MPGFKDGKYGKFNSYYQFIETLSRVEQLLIEAGNDALAAKARQFSDKLASKTGKVRNVEKLPLGQELISNSSQRIMYYLNVPGLSDESEAIQG